MENTGWGVGYKALVGVLGMERGVEGMENVGRRV